MKKPMKNNTLKEIETALFAARRILVLPHVNMDGDTLGSSVAICRALRSSGREAVVLIDETIPDNLQFLDHGECTADLEAFKNPDLCIAVDCSDVHRLGSRKDHFLQAPLKICVDHHETNDSFADMNYIEPATAATGEIVYRLLSLTSTSSGRDLIDQKTAEAIYSAIVTDTGNFQYSNTTAQTHLIVADLFGKGIDHSGVSVKLYQNMRAERLILQTKILETMEFFCDGHVNLAYVTQDMLKETGGAMDETEGVVEALRNLRDVEISIFLKENAEREIKVSFRAKSYGDVASISGVFGGGGHKKAAGCTIRKPLKEAIELVRKEVEAQFQWQESLFE